VKVATSGHWHENLRLKAVFTGLFSGSEESHGTQSDLNRKTVKNEGKVACPCEKPITDCTPMLEHWNVVQLPP
jgi:hypothetical protein